MFNSFSTDHTSNPLLDFFGTVLSYVSIEIVKYDFFAISFALITDIDFLYFLTDIFSVHNIFSAIISFSLSILGIYILSISWIFDKRRLSDNSNNLFAFALIGIIGLGINALGLYLLTSIAVLYNFFQGINHLIGL